MAPMPDRQTPAQAGLFDTPRAPDAPPGDAGETPVQAEGPALPLPDFLADDTATLPPAAPPPRAVKVRDVYVERVYNSSDFSTLGIGT